jgi:hypothetical protein
MSPAHRTSSSGASGSCTGHQSSFGHWRADMYLDLVSRGSGVPGTGASEGEDESRALIPGTPWRTRF